MNYHDSEFEDHLRSLLRHTRRVAPCILAIVVLTFSACSDDEPEGYFGQCPAGAEFDSEADRCVIMSDTGEDDAIFADIPTAPSEDTGDEPSEDTGDEPPPCAHDQCGDDCVDLTSSPVHCGECNQACDAPRSCQDGQCICPGSDDYCGGDCIDTSTDDNHCGSCGNTCPGGELCVEGDCHPDEKVGGVIHHMNEARSTETDCDSEGVFPAAAPVEGHPLLHEASQVHADDMAENDFFSHEGSDGSSFSQRIYATGYSGSPVGENIAAGDTDPEIVVQRWLDSDGHCRNLMSSSANQVGIGFSLGGQWGSFWVLKLASGY